MNSICLICDSNDKSLLVEMQCNHCYCKDCLNLYFKIDENFSLEFFTCPADNCNQILNQDDLRKFVDDYDIVVEQMFQNNICFDLQQNERMITCFNSQCKCKFIIWKDADYYKCPQCLLSFCLKCKLYQHPKINCLQNMRAKAETQTRMNILDFTMQNSAQYKPCPSCLNLIEKNNGCNYITCQSPQCRGLTHFCFQCGESLRKEELQIHYQNDDYFQGNCRVKVNGVWQDRDQHKLNDFACPGCQTKDQQFCNIDENVNKLYIICTSQKCVYKAYCLDCKKCLNNQTLYQHIQNNFQHKAKKIVQCN